MKELLIREYKNLNNKKRLKLFDCEHCEFNSSCGDEITIYLKLDKDKKIIKDASFEGCGCVISLVTANRFIDKIKNKPLNEIKKMNEKDIIKLLGFPINPARSKCATLILRTAKEAIKKIELKK